MWVFAARAAALVLSVRTAAAFRPDHGSRDFATMDADGDGLLSAAEVEVHIDARLGAEIDGFMTFFDANGDVEVTRSEYEAQASKFFVTDQRTADWFWKSVFATNDASETGVITPAMLREKKSLLLTASAQEKSRQWMAEHDKDGDKQITKKEYGGSPSMWALLDPDGDGVTNARDYLKIGGQFAKPHLIINPHDVDLDGQLSASEFATMHHEL